MELRSTTIRRNRHEYKELQVTLSGLGLHEEGMTLPEMRQLMQALQHSESSVLDDELERAVRESELDFVMLPADDVVNSTMISSGEAAAGAVLRESNSRGSSPDLPAQHFAVVADVHHSYSWSPPGFVDRSPPPEICVSAATSPSKTMSPKRRKLAIEIDVGSDTGLSASDSGIVSGLSSVLSVASSGTLSTGFSDSLASSRNSTASNEISSGWEEQQEASRSSVVISSDDNQSLPVSDVTDEAENSGDQFGQIFTHFTLATASRPAGEEGQ